MIIDELGDYKRRDNKKVRVVCIDKPGDDPVLCYNILGGHDYTTSINGYLIGEKSPDEADIVAKWEEPKPRMKVWRSRETGAIFISEQEPSNHMNYETINLREFLED